MNTYDLGNVVVLASAFVLKATNAPADPTDVTLRILDPDGGEQIESWSALQGGALTHGTAGVFTYNLQVLKPGVWYYRFEGAGAVTAAQDGQFVVTSTPFADAD